MVTNPPSLSFVVYIAASLRRAHVVLRVEDVYPDVLVATGLARARSLPVRVMSKLTKLLYRRMDRIVVLGRDMASLVSRHMGDRSERIVLIPNWGDVESVAPLPREPNPILSQISAEAKFVVQYMGNMGRTHGVDTLAEAALRLRGDERIHFLFVGWGARKAALERFVEEHALTHVSILPPCSQEELPVYANAADIVVIAFQNGMAGVSVPSRMYNVMAAGKPILAVAERHSELARVVAEERIGWVVEPSNAAALADAIGAAVATSREELSSMGARARTAAVSEYSREHVIASYARLFDELQMKGS